MPTIRSAADLDAWVHERFPGRQWQKGFKQYLEGCKAARKQCQHDSDDPSLQDCCLAVKDFGAPLSCFKDFDPAERPHFANRLNAKLVAYRKKQTAMPHGTQDLRQGAASSSNPTTAPGHSREQASVTRATSHDGPLADVGSDVGAAPPPKRVCTENSGSTSRLEQAAAPAPDTTLEQATMASLPGQTQPPPNTDTPIPDTTSESPGFAVDVGGLTSAKRVRTKAPEGTEERELEPIATAAVHVPTPVKRAKP